VIASTEFFFTRDIIAGMTHPIPHDIETPAAVAHGAELAVLESKLHPPALHPEHLSRPRLLRLLDESTARRLALVDAPVGFGKTTLLAEWCVSVSPSRRCAWITFDEQDNDPTVFWTYVLHALRRAAPDCISDGLMIVHTPGASVTRTMVSHLLNDLWRLDHPVSIILDDYHKVTDGECHESMRFFLQRLPPMLHVVISTRSDPPIALGTMRARGGLTDVREAVLRFTAEETAALLNDSLRLELEPDDLSRLGERTEGWAAGLYLAALSLRDRPDAADFIAEFGGEDRHIVDFLGGEVLDRLPEDMQRFLLRTSILERFSAPLCDAVAGVTGSAERLRTLEQTNHFLIPLDQRREWYRFHHLFAELLRVELRVSEPDLVPELHRRAAAWYQATGDAVATMTHALAARDYTLAGDLFLQNTRALQQMGRLATVVSWMDQIPDEVIAARPPLAIAVANVCSLALRPQAEVERWLNCAEGSDDSGPYWLGEHSARAASAVMRAAFPFDDVGGALQAAQEAVETETDPRTFSFMVAQGALGQALFLSGRASEARAPLEVALRAPLAEQQSVTLVRVLAQLALVNLELGERSRAEDLARRAVQQCIDRGLTQAPSAWHVFAALAVVLVGEGRFVEAEAVLSEHIEPHLPQMARWPIMCLQSLLVLASVRAAQGHVRAAYSLIEEARAAIRACKHPGILPALLSKTERGLQRVPRRETGLRDELSEGEIRILRLLAGDLTQREIGRELYLSMNTIKTHTRSIYSKLDVASREEAVLRARTLGLIA
jgi:LuxR family maltose regulon positive regulatory protein